jgi:hypothetical protein
LARSAADRGFGTSSDSEVLEQELEMHSTSGSFLADGAFLAQKYAPIGIDFESISVCFIVDCAIVYIYI